jgi:putative ABC transport system substrate-binding protein
MMTRREILFALGACMLTPFQTAAQQQLGGHKFRIGYIGNSTAEQESDMLNGFRRGLSERGYTEGKDITVEYRWAGGRYEQLPTIIAELLALNVDVLVVSGTPAALAAKKATTRPIVFAAVGDAVGTGIVTTLAKPGHNITGLTSAQLEGKRIQLIQELAPHIKTIGLLANLSNQLTPAFVKSTLAATKSVGIAAQVYDVRNVEEIEKAFAAIVRAKLHAFKVLPDRVLLAYRKPIVQFAKQERLPAVYPFSEFVEEGGLISYAPNFADMYRRSATYVDKILKGAKPGDLPVEQPTLFETTINMTTAKLLGIKVPQSILIQATKVIE